MAKPRNDLLDRAAYIGFRLLATFMHCFKINANHRAARMIGSLLYRLDKRHRNRALVNLERCFPELSPAQREQLALKSVQSMLMIVVDFLFTTRLVRVETWRDCFELHDFDQTLRLLMDDKRGLIMLTGHYGNWEVLGYVLATLGFQTTSVARPLDNPYISHWVFDIREKRGQKLLHKKGATQEIPQILSNGGAVGFVADQNAGKKGMFVDFFGRKASTYKSIGLLAMEYRVPVVIGYAQRLDEGFHFRVATQDIIWPDDWKDQRDPLLYITQRYTKAIEDFVRQVPEQYLWVHRRWKTRPKGEAPLPYD